MSLLTQDELNLLSSDSKYKNYVNSIEKSLKNFESSSEWADLISSLGKLKKCLQSFPKYQYIPKRVSVCKRLAQCLHPALPSGVHLKALEVYTCIFQNIGTENLAKDLFLYSSGLFPLLANAALSVKPILLNLYETYFLPLKKSLRPCLTGLIIGLLPGLEEGSDFYQRTFNLLKNICLAQSDLFAQITNTSNYIPDDKYFYTCIWSAIISQSSIRFPAIQFIWSNYENKKKISTSTVSQDDQLYLIGNSIDLMINALCCCLQDPNPLVQRSTLDLICLCLPINTKHVTRGDKLQLIIVAIHVVLRRDMSLNRRIYSWLMGNSSIASSSNEETSSSKKSNISNDQNYFNTHSKNLLIQSIKMLLNKKESSSILYLLNDDPSINIAQSNTINSNSVLALQTSQTTNTTLKLVKIVSNLVERQEIGQAIIDDILLDFLFYVYKEYSNLNSFQASSVQTYLNLKKNFSINFQQQQNQQAQNLKESSELKKATCNFLFQSFQIYFIWEFCSNKFELICKNFTTFNSDQTSSESNESNQITPGQLCDLYEFILDLLTNSDIYNEIQTEHLPLMLNRIIQTLNLYCYKMTNLDLSKSLLLCLKILNKIKKLKNLVLIHEVADAVVPKIIVPDTTNNSSTKLKVAKQTNSLTKIDQKLSSTDKINTDDIVKDLMNDLLNIIENNESNENQTDLVYNKNLLILNENDNCNESNQKLTNISNHTNKNENFLIEDCLSNLKKLCHTFIKNHLYQLNSTESTLQQEQIDKSFKSIFNTISNLQSFRYQNDDGYLFDSNNSDLIHIRLKQNSLNYLQSFQILNKLLIKMLFFPREQENLTNSLNQYDSTDSVINSFEDWLKDLFIISSTSIFNQTKVLFELQSVTLNTLIELIHLSESVNSHLPTKKSQSDPKRLLHSIFNKRQIDIIYTQSKFGYLTAQMLWSHLNSNSQLDQSQTNSTDKRASILFCLLHELLPNNLCEDIIINNLILQQQTDSNLSNKIDSFKRFTRLWHWSRELNSNSDLKNDENSLNSDDLSISTIKYGKLTKTFERCLLIILDLLSKEDTPQSLIKLIQDWLISSITDYNDLSRLIDILLVSLLHPSTARVSVQYFINNLFINTSHLSSNSNNMSKFYLNEDETDHSENNYESKVYAISNEGGNVKYHVSNSNDSSSLTNSFNQSTKQPQFLLTSIDQTSQTSSINKQIRNIELPLSILNAASLTNQGTGLNLRINPFLDDSEDLDQEQIDNSKTTKLLETYKAIKLKENTNNNLNKQLKPSPSISPNLSGSSEQINQINNRLSIETNQSEDITVDLEDELEEDEDNEEIDENEDENDFFMNSDDDYEDDTHSQSTDITLLSSQPNQIDTNKSPSMNKKSLKKASPKQKVKLISKQKKSQTSHLKSPNKQQNDNLTNQQKSDDLNQRPNKLSDKLFKELQVDLANSFDLNYSHMLIYINCNNIQTSLSTSCPNKLYVSSKFSNSSYDHVRTLFILKCIEQLLTKCGKEFLSSISTTLITNQKSYGNSNPIYNNNQDQVFSVHNEKLIDLILKHLKSIYGDNFYSTSSNITNFSINLNQMSYLEAISLILIFYIRSYYPPSFFVLKSGEDLRKSGSFNSLQSLNDLTNSNEMFINKREQHDFNQFQENRNIQIYAIKIMNKLFKELYNLVSSSSTTYSNSQLSIYQKVISDYLEKLKIQKTFLHLFFSTINLPLQNTISNLILQNSASNNNNNNRQVQYSYITELMSCMESLVELERIVNDYQQTIKYLKNGLLQSQARLNTENLDTDDFLLTIIQNNKKQNPIITINNNSINQSIAQSTKYVPGQTIFNQSMFISSILYYLKNMSLVEYHLDVLKLIRNTISSSGISLKSISTYIIEQLCRNLLYITNGGLNQSGSSSSSSNYIQPIISYMSHVSVSINIPDLIINMLKQLSFMLNYCLITNYNLNTNFLNFNPELNSETQFKLFKQFQVDNEVNLMQAKECLIHLFPSILSSMAQVWQRCNLLLSSQSLLNTTVIDQVQNYQYSWILGHPVIIKQCITDLLNPIAQYHSTHFMIAIGNVWGEKRKKSRLYQEHKIIIELIRSLKTLPLSTIIQNVTDILKQSSLNTNKDKKKSPLNIWLLQFLHSYLDYNLTQSSSINNKAKLNSINSSKLIAYSSTDLNNSDLASCLCTFFKETLKETSNFAPACYFQLFRILHDCVNNFSLLVDDKKYSKDIQEATHKLFELCNSIVASSLQQTTWLRKNFAVKLVPQIAPSTNNGSNTSTPMSVGPVMIPSLNNSSVTAVASGPSAGGASLLIHNESTNSIQSSSLSINTNNSAISNNTSGYAGSNGLTNSTTIGTMANSVSNSSKSNLNNNLSDFENEIVSNLSDHGTNLNSIDHLNGLAGDLNDSNNNLAYSLQALNILAEYLAKTLDIVYKSDEKDRLVIPILMSLMSNLWPYLKTHSVANKNNFRAASHLLMSLTVYPYTRKTWKKEVFEMLFDNSYFQVDSATLDYSKTIIDNLISNDRTMFKDVLSRVTYQQSSGLFTSKEQESEQKAQLLKRLAFVIYSSEKDQYQKNMPEIQECIAHVLRLVQSVNLYSTLLLLFRILLLRISSRHLVALWPTIISELILILLQIEQDLTEEIEIKNGSKSSYLDHISSTQSTNAKLQIYLSACKLIDLILTLPSSLTPQFQFYKWSFINTEDALNLKQKDQFVPYLTKINNLLKSKFPNNKIVSNLKPGTTGPLIKLKQIQNLVDLKPFFEYVTTHQFVHSSNQTHSINSQQLQQSLLVTTNLKLFESSVHEDFLEGWIQ